jgi:hypothetical protein
MLSRYGVKRLKLMYIKIYSFIYLKKKRWTCMESLMEHLATIAEYPWKSFLFL